MLPNTNKTITLYYKNECGMKKNGEHMRRFIAFIFVAARISIAKSWKSPMIPFDLLKTKLSLIMINKLLLAILHDKLVFFEKIWDPWIPVGRLIRRVRQYTF